MKLRVTDQIHISSVSANTLTAGAEIEVSDALGGELLKKHPDKVAAIAAAKPAPAGRGAKGKGAKGEELRQDGPTVAEYVAAGYFAEKYPPAGYASKSTQAEIDAAIAAQKSASGSGAKSEAPGANKAEGAPANKAETPGANKQQEQQGSKGGDK